MKLRGKKKQANGRSVAIFDTEGQDIGGVVEMMTRAGWRFNKLQVTYTANDGTKKHKNVPAARAAEIYARYGFTKWSFEAVNGSASVTGTMDCSKYAIAITGSRGGGYQMLDGMRPAHDPRLQQQTQAYYPQQQQAAYQQPYQQQAVQQQPYGTPYTTQAEQMREADRLQAREAERAADAATTTNEKQSKHGAYIFFAIIEMLFIAPIVFALFAISDTLKGRKALEYDTKEANKHFKEARNLLIGGAIAAIVFAGILYWKFGSYIATYLPFQIPFIS